MRSADPSVGMAASPFWVDVGMLEVSFGRPVRPESRAVLAHLQAAGAKLSGLRVLDGALVLRIARGRKAEKVRVVDADAGDAHAVRSHGDAVAR